MSDKGNFKTKTVKKEKEALYKDKRINTRKELYPHQHICN